MEVQSASSRDHRGAPVSVFVWEVELAEPDQSLDVGLEPADVEMAAPADRIGLNVEIRRLAELQPALLHLNAKGASGVGIDESRDTGHLALAVLKRKSGAHGSSR